MTWARLDDRANEHRKQLAAGPEACWLWACGLMYCNRQAARNGFIPEQALRILYPLKSPSRLATKLVDVGLWERIDGGYQVHEFECWNKSKEHVEADRESTRNRVTAHRERKRGTQIGEKKLENDQKIGEKQSVILQQSEALSRLTNSRFRGIHGENERSNADCNTVTPNDCNAVSNANVLDPLHSTPTPRVISNPAAAAADPSTMPRATEPQPQQSPEKESGTHPIPGKTPSIQSRAAEKLRDPTSANWDRPASWPELVTAADAFAAALGLKKPRLGGMSDAGVRALLELFAAGFTPDELSTAANAAKTDPWCQNSTAKRGLSSISPEVVRRLLDPREMKPSKSADNFTETAEYREMQAML